MGVWLFRSVACVTLLLFAVVLTNEFARYDIHLSECQSAFDTHVLFTERSICRDDAQRDKFETHDLIQCSRAEHYIKSMRPSVCALRLWFPNSWIGESWYTGWQAVTDVWGRTTGYIGLAMILMAAVSIYWIQVHNAAKTEQIAIQQEPMTAMTELMSNMQRQQNMVGRSLPSVVDVTERDEGEADTDVYFDARAK